MRWFVQFGAWRRAKFEPGLNINEEITQISGGQEIGSRIQDEFSALTKQLKREHFKEQRQLIGERIKKAEASNNETALQEALKEFDQVSKMMQNI